jgi:hypothetical protein
VFDFLWNHSAFTRLPQTPCRAAYQFDRKDLLTISDEVLSVQAFCVFVHSFTIACSFQDVALRHRNCQTQNV